MEADGLGVLDVERCVLSGSIVERQIDRSTGERKFVILGLTLDGEDCVVIAKLTATGKLGVLTVFLVDG